MGSGLELSVLYVDCPTIWVTVVESISYEEQNFHDYSIGYENLTYKNQETLDYLGGLLIECGFWGRLMANNPGIQSG
jgi:hypothetical protein